MLFSCLALVLACAIGARCIQTVWTAADAFSAPVYRVQTEEKRAAITFDVEWNDRQIEELLAVVEQNGAAATFFVTGRWAETHADSLQKIAAAGCEVGNHSDTHPHMAKMPAEQMIVQMESCNRKVKSILGRTPALFRSPYGEENAEMMAAAEEARLLFVQWDVEALRTKENTGLGVIQRPMPP
ncbi:polysaccharide deacetylase family protein [Clostridium sp. D33t1_170424_F3]|uniref:polysaccharide deacetylase family protein n=1 Tax=Clostridium sp. D33t1_170424_F3 TaxID=2787099 RepID=UPI0018AAD4E6|nr:polysaccharide deacetylase family protein [Clostridium sp. D33t1_170424_F3]